MKLNDLLTNPSGQGSAAVGARYLILRAYNEKAIEMIRQGKLITPNVYKIKGGGYVVHFLIPSEKYNVQFDTVFTITKPKDLDQKFDSNLGEYNVKVFSNIPSFGFIYAYVANDTDILVDELKNKFDSIFFTKPPEVKNPQRVYGFEKAITLAALYMEKNKLKFKQNMDKLAKDTINWKTFDQVVTSFSRKLNQYNAAKKEHVDANKKAKAAAKLAKQKAKTQQNSNSFNQSSKSSTGQVQVQVNRGQVLTPLIGNSASKPRNTAMKPIINHNIPTNKLKSALKPIISNKKKR